MKWITLLALLVSPLVNAVTLDELQQRFAEQPVVRAHFESRICLSPCARRGRC